MFTALQCISLFTSLAISTPWPHGFKVIEKIESNYIERTYTIPYVEQLPGVIDARLQNGRMKMTESMKKGGVFLFIDVNNLNKINKLFERSTGDAYITSVVSEIQKLIGEKGEIYRLGGDEFAIVLPLRSPIQIQTLIGTLENAVMNNSQATLRSSIQAAGKIQIQKLSSLSDPMARQIQIDFFRDEIARYSRASVSIGAAYIDPYNQTKTQEIAEDRARIRKIKIKAKAGLSVAKYGSSLVVDTSKKPSFGMNAPPELISFEKFPTIAPAPLPSHIEPKAGQPHATGFILLFDHPEFSIVEAFDEFHRSSFWIQNKVEPDSKPRILHASAVTELPSLITSEGQAFDQKFKMSIKTPRARIEFKLAGLMHFNYFRDGIESGDRALRLMGNLLQVAIKKELRSQLRSSDIVFSGMGSDFIVFVENVPESIALDIQKRVVTSVANSPAIQKLIHDELAHLESDPATASLVPKLREALDPAKLIESTSNQFQYFHIQPGN